MRKGIWKAFVLVPEHNSRTDLQLHFGEIHKNKWVETKWRIISTKILSQASALMAQWNLFYHLIYNLSFPSGTVWDIRIHCCSSDIFHSGFIIDLLVERTKILGTDFGSCYFSALSFHQVPPDWHSAAPEYCSIFSPLSTCW